MITLLLGTLALGALCSNEPQPQNAESNIIDYMGYLAAERSAHYSMIYSVEDRQLRRVREGMSVRWDDVTVYEDGFTGSSTLLGEGNSGTCLWETAIKPEFLTVSCWSPKDMSEWLVVFEPFFNQTVESLSSGSLTFDRRDVMGQDADCFTVDNLTVDGTICFSDRAVPVTLDARDRTLGRYHTKPISVVLDAPADASVPLTAEGFSARFSRRDYAREDVSLPTLPALKSALNSSAESS